MISMTLIRNRLQRDLYNKKGFILTLLLPIIAVILGTMANNISTPTLRIAVVENSTDISNTYASSLSESLNIVDGIDSRYYETPHYTTDLIMGSYDILLEASAPRKIHYTALRNTQYEQPIRNLIDTIDTEQGALPTLSEYVMSESLTPTHKLLSFILLLLFVTCTVNGSILIRDKHNGLLRRIRFSPITMRRYITANIIYIFLMTLIQLFLAFSFIYIFAIPMGLPFSSILFIGFIISLMATAFGTCIAILFDHELYANLFSSVIALIFSLFGGTFITFPNMPPMMQTLSILSPTRWLMVISDKLTIGQPMADLFPYILLCALFTVASLAIAIYRSLHAATT